MQDKKEKRQPNIYQAQDGENAPIGKPLVAYTAGEARAKMKKQNGLSSKERLPVGVTMVKVGVYEPILPGILGATNAATE